MANEQASSPIPNDTFSRELRALKDDPGAISSTSTIQAQDFYGNTATWVLETFRDADGNEKVFAQRIDWVGGQRLVLPPAVTAALARHREQLSARAKRRQGHRLVAQRKERGDTLGNPEALRLARGRQAARKGGAK
jgi:hypothetical protein